MKEIDFLPEWYKNGRRRQVSYRTQYVAIAGVFMVMAAWSFITTHSISKARAEFIQRAAKQTQAEKISAQLSDLEDETKKLRVKSEWLERLDSKIDVASVLAEISFLIGEKVVLKKTEFIAEKFEEKKKTEMSPNSGTIVRAVRVGSNTKTELPLGNVRFKVLITGVAADAGDVATLMCKMEDSPYFNHVVLSYSRANAEIGIKKETPNRSKINIDNRSLEQTDVADESEIRTNIQANEFEINCYLANYREL